MVLLASINGLSVRPGQMPSRGSTGSVTGGRVKTRWRAFARIPIPQGCYSKVPCPEAREAFSYRRVNPYILLSSG